MKDEKKGAMEVVFSGGKKVDVKYRGFTVRTDQTEEAGGDNTAPDPFELYLISIAACMGYYVLAFMQARGIRSEGTTLSVGFEREPGDRPVTRVQADIHLPEDFPAKYEHAVVRAARSCTVKESMADPPDFDIRAAGTGESVRSAPASRPPE